MTSRREFLGRLGGAVAAVFPFRSMGARLETMSPTAAIKLGYAAITWGGDDQRAMMDISALGFTGIQLRANVLTRFGQRPEALRDLLAKHGLTFVALSSGNVSIDPSAEARVIEQHVGHARFLRAAGGLYLQLIDERPRGRAVEPADYPRLGRLLTEIGKRTADLGIPVAFHHHVGSLGEKPDEIDRILAASDPRYVRLLLDVAHYQVAGGDPVAAIRRHSERLLLLHIKDVRNRVPADTATPPFQFVELGRGSVDLPGVFAALREVAFGGWAVVELDSVPDRDRTPAQAAAVSKRYLEEVIGLRVS